MFAIGKDRLGIFKHTNVSSHAITGAIERIDLIAFSGLVQFFKLLGLSLMSSGFVHIVKLCLFSGLFLKNPFN